MVGIVVNLVTMIVVVVDMVFRRARWRGSGVA